MLVERDTPCMSILLASELGYTLHVHTAGSANRYNLHVHRQLEMLLFLLYCIILKNHMYAGMPDKILVRHYISSGSQLPQSGIGIPAQGSVRYSSQSQIGPALPIHGKYQHD
jgi:hypothetical protein